MAVDFPLPLSPTSATVWIINQIECLHNQIKDSSTIVTKPSQEREVQQIEVKFKYLPIPLPPRSIQALF